MTLITSQSFKREEHSVAKKTAKEDIVRENAYGQQVVVVPKGQEYEDSDLEPSVPIQNADQVVEDKAKRSSKGK